MKRKYAAMILGLTMALTSANLAYAADSSDTATEAAVRPHRPRVKHVICVTK